MFTGIIETTAIIKDLSTNEQGATLCVVSGLSKELNIGDSVSINGACSTVVYKDNNEFTVEYSNHTLSLTTILSLSNKSVVNLERALKVSDRLDGHIVTGHIDGVAKFVKQEKDGFSYMLEFEIPNEYIKQTVTKGSIAINGISLTIAKCETSTITVAIIPHTFENTNLKYLKIGDKVNFETDITAKYIEKMLFTNDNKKKKENSKIDMNFLSEKGFM